MPVEIDGEINDGEHAWIDITPTDIDGTSVTPKQLWYWWADENGNIINDRHEVEFTGLLSTVVQVELTPDDTTLAIPRDLPCVFTTRYIYDSARGNDKVRTEVGTVTIKSIDAIHP